MKQVVAEIQGKQYFLEENQKVFVDLLPNNIGDIIKLDKILSASNGSDINIGTPFLDNVKVEIEILSQEKAPKIRGFKYKRRKNYHKSWGHRQKYHCILVKSVGIV